MGGMRPKFTFSSVKGYKVSRYRVESATPESVATAKVVPRLKPEQGVPSSEHAVLNYKLPVPCCVASAVARKAATPIVGFTTRLVNSG